MSETPQPPYQQPGQQPPYQQPGQQPPYQQPYAPVPTAGKATTSLILGIVSLVACGFLVGIPAMVIGRQARREIRESGGRLGGDGLAQAGFWTGLVGTVWSVLVTILVIGLFVFSASFFHSVEKCVQSSQDDPYSTTDCD